MTNVKQKVNGALRRAIHAAKAKSSRQREQPKTALSNTCKPWNRLKTNQNDVLNTKNYHLISFDCRDMMRTDTSGWRSVDGVQCSLQWRCVDVQSEWQAIDNRNRCISLWKTISNGWSSTIWSMQTRAQHNSASHADPTITTLAKQDSDLMSLATAINWRKYTK